MSALVKDSSGHRLDGRIQRYYQNIRGSGSFSYETPDPITTLDDPDVLSHVLEQQTSGSAYDRSNQYKLSDLLPAKFTEDDNLGGSNLIKNFLFVMGRQYDQIKLFIDQLGNFMKVEHGDYDQTPDALLDEVGKFFGWNFDGSFSDANSLKYSIGRSVSAGPVGNKDLDTKLFEIKNQLWKRTLLNLMHLYKMKGTRESVESLMRVYGLNKSFVKLKEYGSRTNEELVAQRIKSEKSTYSLFLGTGSLNSGSVSWSVGPVSGSSGSVLMTTSFAAPFGVGLDRPTTAGALSASLGITSLATHIWPMTETTGTVLVDTIRQVALTSSSATAARIGITAIGLPAPSTMSLTGGLVAADIEGYAVNYFANSNNTDLDFPSGSFAFFGIFKFHNANNGQRGWFGKLNTGSLNGYGIEMVSGIPYVRMGDGGTGGTKVFQPTESTFLDGTWH